MLISLPDTITRYQLATKKSLGQHFLLDMNLTAKIARAAGDLAGVHVIEIGPGPGGLTRALLDTDAQSVTAFEKDTRCVAALGELRAHYGERFVLHEEDALAVDLPARIASPRAIVANLPYNIGTELVTRWLAQWYHDADAYTSITVMLQKEVAMRIAAPVGSKDYGRLSVMAQFIATPRLLFDVPPGAFSPPPKVDSTILHLTRRAHEECDLEALERVTRAAFGNRRKMLRQSLKTLRTDAVAWCESAGIDPTRRAETLSVAEFVGLAGGAANYITRDSAS